ncbi:methyltransferase-like protein [Hypoxylon argillaceum]|nr:methyltransferase-like protein [Hypoxylon argillaceum]KAI1147121.1 methyltransferase-like protein [Nemania diffusa]
MESQLNKEYNSQGGRYSDYITQLPLAPLETELFQTALGDCTGLTVLDLGGGSGLKAREAIDRGAVAVDVVDLSSEMMRVGQEVEKSLGRHEAGVISWNTGDIAQSLTHLPLRPSYDLVLVGWTFDHAHNLAEYEGMWRNAAAYLKPGGRLVSVRVGDIRGAAWDGRYGNVSSAIQEMADGLEYRYALLMDPPVEFEASSLYISMTGNTELPEKYGFTSFSSVLPEDTSVVKADPEFWKPFIENPGFVVFHAKKISDV